MPGYGTWHQSNLTFDRTAILEYATCPAYILEVQRFVPWLCLLMTLTTPNAVWALAVGDCATASDSVTAEAMDHGAMDHSAHQGRADAQHDTASPAECACCADDCVAHCIGGAACVRFEPLRAYDGIPGPITEVRHGASYFPSPPISGLFRPPIYS